MSESDGPNMITFLADKMVEADPEETMFGAMIKLVMAIWWTDAKGRYATHDQRSVHSVIHRRCLDVSLPPPIPSQIGAWTTMVCDGFADPTTFADLEFVTWVREALNRRTILDVKL